MTLLYVSASNIKKTTLDGLSETMVSSFHRRGILTFKVSKFHECDWFHGFMVTHTYLSISIYPNGLRPVRRPPFLLNRVEGHVQMIITLLPEELRNSLRAQCQKTNVLELVEPGSAATGGGRSYEPVLSPGWPFWIIFGAKTWYHFSFFVSLTSMSSKIIPKVANIRSKIPPVHELHVLLHV